MLPPASTQTLLAPKLLNAALWGALGGLLGFLLGEQLGGGIEGSADWISAVTSTAIWFGGVALPMGATILIADNRAGLRGQWHRNLALAVPLFLVFGALAGAVAQAFFGAAQAVLPLLAVCRAAWAGR